MSAPAPDRTSEPAGRGGSSRRTQRPVLIEGGAANRRLARIPFLLVLIGIFGVGMAGLLALNTTLQGQAFESRSLHERANQLTYQEAALTRRVDELRSVDNLAARASKLGMRPNPDPAFVQLPDGKVIGNPEPVTGDEIPSLVVKTPEQLAAEKEAKEAKKRAAEAKKQAERAKREADRAARQQQQKKTDEQNQQTAGQAQQGQAQQGQAAGQNGDEQQPTGQQGQNGRGNGQSANTQSGNGPAGNSNTGEQSTGNQTQSNQNGRG